MNLDEAIGYVPDIYDLNSTIEAHNSAGFENNMKNEFFTKQFFSDKAFVDSIVIKYDISLSDTLLEL